MDSFKLKMPFLSQKSENIYFSRKVTVFLKQISYFTFSLTGKLGYLLIHLITHSQVTNIASLLEDSWAVCYSMGRPNWWGDVWTCQDTGWPVPRGLVCRHWFRTHAHPEKTSYTILKTLAWQIENFSATSLSLQLWSYKYANTYLASYMWAILFISKVKHTQILFHPFPITVNFVSVKLILEIFKA